VIISHEHRFVFLKTKKTAGSSIEIALSTICGPRDVITPIGTDEALRAEFGGRGPQNHESPELAVRLFNHAPARRAREAIGADVFDSYFTFTVERNPWDAVVSLYYYRARLTGRSSDFGRYLRRPVVAKMAQQNYRIWHRGHRSMAQRVLRYEHLADDLATLWRDLDLPGSPALPRAKSGFRPTGFYRDLYDDAGRDVVAQAFAPMIEELGYEF